MNDDARTDWQRLKVSSDDNSLVAVEVVTRGGREEVGVLDALPFEQVTDAISTIARAIGETLEKAKPKKATVELGIEFGIQEGRLVALVARGSGKANLKIVLEWESA